MWKEIWIIMIVVGSLLFTVGVILMYIWDIPSLVDELSGKKAKRQIKMLHDMNSSTGTFDKLSTNEIYSTIPSGSLISGELANTSDFNILPISNNSINFSENISSEEDLEESTTYINADEEESTSYLSVESCESTSFLDVTKGNNVNSVEGFKNSKTIKVIEEQSSLEEVER